MAKEDLSRFVCSECGHISTKWLGRCPDCGNWNTFSEEKIYKTKGSSHNSDNISSTVLSDVPDEIDFRFDSGITELDRVLGGGIVRSSSVLVGGEPGIGKSTLMLQVAATCSARRSVLYISGEENGSQIRQRAQRLNLDLTRINLLCETDLDSIIHVISKEKPQIVIIDSLQTVSSKEIASIAGSVTQMRTCCSQIIATCKANGTSVFFIGHVTKEGTIAGPKIVEHMVDTVLYFEEASLGIRLIRSVKNRFGSVDEIGIFMMNSNGLEGIKDPSNFFISERLEKTLPPGIAYTTIIEGSRTFVVEIQALVTEAKTGYGHVYSDKIESSRVQKVAAILERHAAIRLSDRDIYVNVAKGVKVNDVSVELALAVALYSAVYNIRLSSKAICIGELSLAGEVRNVNFISRRLKSAYEMGFDKAIVPSSVNEETKLSLHRCSRISDIKNLSE